MLTQRSYVGFPVTSSDLQERHFLNILHEIFNKLKTVKTMESTLSL